MIIRKRTYPIVLKKYEALLRRLPPTFHQISDVEAAFRKQLKGYHGELLVDRQTDRLKDRSTILYNVQLQFRGNSFQMDTIVITTYAVYIIEIKNFDGILTFDTFFDQLIRYNGSKEEGFRSPITQATTQANLLKQWLHKHDYIDIPIYSFIAISRPSTVIKVDGDKNKIRETVMHAEFIPQKISEYERIFKNKDFTPLAHAQIGKIIAEKSMTFDKDILAVHNINKKWILSGVQCSDCNNLKLQRVHGNWHCEPCRKKWRYAHRQAIKDYFLLIQPYITNKTCREFLHVSSRFTANRILQSMNLIFDEKDKLWKLPN
ncbi:nuclease-related domain-containing protein [Virgibacillus sp. Bac330]|uniref:nuclease-related domain-containing protein n=1 Tax=Virgibacillus sp. Bac330 TaxID=2419841 RepID=UPI000EF43C98|nr:nuclease-related domain-containing protein [Virgibacillus sp. Bac330]